MEELFGLLGNIGTVITYIVIAIVAFIIWRAISGKPVRVVNRSALPVKIVGDEPKSVNHNGKPENQKRVVQFLDGIVIDSTFWFLLVFTLGIGVIIRHINNLMTNDDFDKLLDSKSKEVASQIADRALESHGMDADEVKEIPPILAEDFYPKSRFSKLFGDETFRASEYQMTYLMFSEKQMYSFRHTFDLTSDDVDEQTNEFFYEDITSVDIAKTKRDMPMPRYWQQIVMFLACMVVPFISLLPFTTGQVSNLVAMLITTVIAGAIGFGFWTLFSRWIESGIWKKIVMGGLIIIATAMTAHLFVKSGSSIAEMESARNVVQNERSTVAQERTTIASQLENATTQYNQTTERMNNAIEEERSLSAQLEEIGDISGLALPQSVLRDIQNTRNRIATLTTQIARDRAQIPNLRTQINSLTTQINPLDVRIANYDAQIEDYNRRIDLNEGLRDALGGLCVLGIFLVVITGLILLFNYGFSRRVVEKLILRLTVAGDEFECAMNTDNIAAIQGMKAKIREKKKV